MEHASSAASGNLPGRGIKLFDSIQRHPRALILVFMIIVLAGIPFAFMKGVPIYSADATIQVSPRFMKTLRDDIELEFQSNTQYLQFIQQQIRTLTRYDVLESALHRLDAQYAGQAHPWRIEGESERRSIYRLQRSVRAFHIRDSYLIRVVVDTTRETGVEDVVNAVVEAYLAVARNEHVFGADLRVSQLEQRQSELLEQIEELTTERTTIAQSLGVTAFNPADVNTFDRQMQRLLEEHTDARTRRIEAETRLNAFLNHKETDLSIRSISESLLSDPGLNSLKASLNQRRAILLTAVSGLAADHPARLDAMEELASIEAEITQRETTLREQLADAILKRYRNSAEQAQAVEERLARTIEEVRMEGRQYAEGFNQALSLNNHIVLLWNELDRVRDRLNFFEAEEAAPGFVRLEAPAMPPLYPTGAGKKKLLILVLLAAGGLSLATPILIDLLDRRIRTVNDAHRVLGFAPMGWTLLQRATPDAGERAFMGEQLRRIASALVREKDRHGTRTLALSAVKPGGGTTSLARTLTLTLNQLGYRALVIEANAYHPHPIYRKGCSANSTDLRQLLNDPTLVARINTASPGIPCIHTAPGSPSLQNLMNLKLALEQFSDFDFVLIDTPPMLTSADAELVIRGCDGGVIVSRAGDITKGELGRAVRMLQRIDPGVAGAIVNAIEPFRGGGYISEMMSEFTERRRVGQPTLARQVATTVWVVIGEAFAMAKAVLVSPVRLTRRLTSSERKR